MSILDDLESLEWGGSGEEEEEEYFDEEFVPDENWDEEDDEASKRSKQRNKARMARRKQQLRAARRQRQRPRRPPRTAKAAIQKQQRDLKEVALENEVRDGAIGGALGSLNQQVRGLHRSVAASPAVNIAQNRITDFFPNLDANGQKLVSDGLAYAPALFLSSKARKEQVIGLIAGLVIGIGGEISRRVQADDKGGAVKIVRDFGDIPEGLKVKLTTNRNGGETWTSADPTIASVDATGVVTGVKYGSTNITATVGTESDVVLVTVVSASGGSKSTSTSK